MQHVNYGITKSPTTLEQFKQLLSDTTGAEYLTDEDIMESEDYNLLCDLEKHPTFHYFTTLGQDKKDYVWERHLTKEGRRDTFCQ